MPAGKGSDAEISDGGTKPGLLFISHGTSIILLVLYLAYLNFQLRTHPDLFRRKHHPGMPEEQEEQEEKKMNLIAAGFSSVSGISSMSSASYISYSLLVITIITAFCADYCRFSLSAWYRFY